MKNSLIFVALSDMVHNVLGGLGPEGRPGTNNFRMRRHHGSFSFLQRDGPSARASRHCTDTRLRL
jgi:hypothetical protein